MTVSSSRRKDYPNVCCEQTELSQYWLWPWEALHRALLPSLFSSAPIKNRRQLPSMCIINSPTEIETDTGCQVTLNWAAKGPLSEDGWDRGMGSPRSQAALRNSVWRTRIGWGGTNHRPAYTLAFLPTRGRQEYFSARGLVFLRPGSAKSTDKLHAALEYLLYRLPTFSRRSLQTVLVSIYCQTFWVNALPLLDLEFVFRSLYIFLSLIYGQTSSTYVSYV